MSRFLGSLSLAGGQGKTTVSLFLGRYLARKGHSVLLVDADPQSSLTRFLGLDVSQRSPTIYEFIRGELASNVILAIDENLFAMPSDNRLENINYELAASGYGLFKLKERFKVEISGEFDYIIVDSPPEQGQMTLGVMGASEYVVIPVESNVKGLLSLSRTLELLKQYQSMLRCEVLGVIPFRCRWYGNNPSLTTRACLDAFKEIAGDKLLPNIPESELFRKSINEFCLSSDFKEGMDFWLDSLYERLSKLEIVECRL